MLAGWGSLASVCAIVWAAFVGQSAISDYRSQKIADKEIDAADAALTAAYRAFDAINQMRARMIRAAESNATEEALGTAGFDLSQMDEATKHANVVRGVIYRRAEYFKSDFDAIFEVIPAAKVYFGSEAVGWLKEFPKARNRLLTSADMFGLVSQPSSYDKDSAVRITRDVFGAPSGEPDEVTDIVSVALQKLEEHLLPHLRTDKAVSK
jgi:hypothetical protein